VTMSLVEIQDRVPKHAQTTSDVITPSFAGRYVQNQIPKYQLPDAEMASNIAYEIIHEELCTEPLKQMNLSSFVTTWMEPEADRLIQETMMKNMVDIQQYPIVHQIHGRTVSIIADLLNASKTAYGTSTTGSAEACILSGLAMKINWQERSKPSSDEKADMSNLRPNLVISKSSHFIWNKFW